MQEKFSDLIKRTRKERNLSTKNLARMLGVKHRTVENWEYGRNPNVIIDFMVRTILALYNKIDQMEKQEAHENCNKKD